MNAFDIAGWGFICAVIGIGFLFRERKLIRLTVTAILSVAGIGATLSVSALSGRLAIDKFERENGNVPVEAKEAIQTLVAINKPHYPYILLAVVGLGVMSVARPGQG